jgi:hypothetical protein
VAQHRVTPTTRTRARSAPFIVALQDGRPLPAVAAGDHGLGRAIGRKAASIESSAIAGNRRASWAGLVYSGQLWIDRIAAAARQRLKKAID